MKNPKISVIIPVYNGQRTLRQCLESVLKQKYKNYEVIVVDNNSTDRSREIILEFRKKDSRVKYLFEAERRRGAARNTGEKSAEGDIILMTDSDCIVPDNWIREIAGQISNNRYDAVQGSEESMADDFWSRQYQMRRMMEIKHIMKQNTALGNIDTKNFAISAAALRGIGFTCRRYLSGNDTELSIRFQKKGLKLCFLNHVKVKHFHPNSLKKVIRRYFDRAFWCVRVTEDHKAYLSRTFFLDKTNQTLGSFFGVFPGLTGAVLRHGFRWAYYDFVTCMSWRAGVIYALAKNEFKK